MRNIVVFVSGRGTNLEAIIHAINNKVLDASILAVVSNNQDAYALTIAKENDIPTECYTYDKNNQTRKEYDIDLAEKIKGYSPDLIVLAGWMHLFTAPFLNQFKNIINLHPALPGKFPGAHAIRDALDAFHKGKVKHTGVMVHHVVEEMDAGKVIGTTIVPVYSTDTLDALTTRVQYFEKPLLLECIQKTLDSQPGYPCKIGKVREMYTTNYNRLCMVHTDRLSAFDRPVCDIKCKGKVLNMTSKFWFDKTRHIVDNHMLYADSNTMIVKKCTPFPVEVVVRGYITGNTNTSLWTVYSAGAREYTGIRFPDGLIKNQKIDTVVTPTTKGETDEPISPAEIINRKLMTQYEWNDVREKALELFKFGQYIASEAGFILVDTKYEFGTDSNGNILLIDELHTCDSSRFWVADTYQERFDTGLDPEKLDKDCVRDYLKETCNPYTDNLVVPDELRDRVSNTYIKFYETLTRCNLPLGNKHYFNVIDTFNLQYTDVAVIIAGSLSDSEHVSKLKKELDKLNIYSVSHYQSAHRNTKNVINLIDHYNERPGKIIWITVAGRSNALSGVVAANSKHPVIACPPFKDKIDMTVNINSSLQCPSNVPVLTVLEPRNVAISVDRMFQL